MKFQPNSMQCKKEAYLVIQWSAERKMPTLWKSSLGVVEISLKIWLRMINSLLRNNQVQIERDIKSKIVVPQILMKWVMGPNDSGNKG